MDAVFRSAVTDIARLRLPGEPAPLALRVRRVLFPEPDDNWLAKEALCAFLSARFSDVPVEAGAYRAFLLQRQGGGLPFPGSAAIRLFRHSRVGEARPPWSLSEWIEGARLSRDPDPSAYRSLGRALHALHRITFPAFCPELDKPQLPVRWSDWFSFMKNGLSTEALAAAIGPRERERIARLRHDLAPPRFVLTHGDLHPANVLATGRETRIIDWDDAGVAPPERDFVVMKYRTRTDGRGAIVPDERLFEAFVLGYCEAGGDAPEPRCLKMHEVIWLMQQFGLARAGPVRDELALHVVAAARALDGA